MRSIGRRTALRQGGVVVVGLLAGCAGGSSGSDGGTATPAGTPTAAEATDGGGETDADGGSGTASVDEWLSNVENYDGTVTDRTGESEVRVVVGAAGNGGAFAFDPPAVRVDPGAEVVWEWTGKGGRHNVVAASGAEFESTLSDAEGHTFSWTPQSRTTAAYYCTPHRSLGMKGAVVVE